MTQNQYAFNKKVVFVTGAGTGIGRAIARAFLDNGATVIVTGREYAPLERVVSEYPTRGVAKVLDVTDGAAVNQLIDEIATHYGHLDVVVSNAGQFMGGSILDVTEEAWRSLFAVNVDGLYHIAKAALPHLIKTKGNIVAVSSVSGSYGDWKQSVYNATKHAVNGLIRSLALDYGEKGVRLNAVAPAFTLTDMTASVGRQPADLAPFVNRIALGRPGLPEDIAPAVLFLASQDAAYITGSILTVDGGTSSSTGQPHLTTDTE